MKVGGKGGGSWSLVAALIFIVILVVTKLQYEHLKVERKWRLTDSTGHGLVDDMNNRIIQEDNTNHQSQLSDVGSLPQGIIESISDLELRPLWTDSNSNSRFRFQPRSVNSTAMLAVAAGVKQMSNVDTMVKKFLSANCSIFLFHYDGNLDPWNNLDWSSKAIHAFAHNQTKWWFAKRFLHPDIVSAYDFIFLWDEDLGVEKFDPGRFLQIISSEGLEISQPALDPDLSEVHHRITVRNRKTKVHRRVYAVQGSLNCSDESTRPPCTGWIEGMAPVFSRAAWRCVWHLIQNDLIHGWGLDMKLGYCAQGARTEKVGVVDSEYIIHHGIPSLGGVSENKAPSRSLDPRAHIRRQSTQELKIFRKRWEEAVRQDQTWQDPFDYDDNAVPD